MSKHKDLIRKAYESLLNDYNHNPLHVVLKDNKKVSVNGSLIRVFSPFISSILSDNTKNVPEIMFPDFSEECFTCLIEILTDGTTTPKTLKNTGHDLSSIKCLAQCLGIEMNNLEFTQDKTGTSTANLRIRIL